MMHDEDAVVMGVIVHLEEERLYHLPPCGGAHKQRVFASQSSWERMMSGLRF